MSIPPVWWPLPLRKPLRSAVRRENVDADPGGLIAAISWVYPDRPLTSEFTRVLDAGYARGADLWHLAVALFVDPDARSGF